MKIHRLPASDPKKFGPKRVRTRRNRTLEDYGQLNLFSGKILYLNSDPPFEQALHLDEQGEYTEAKKYYLKAIDIEDSVADSYCNLGIIVSRNGDYSEAVNYLTLSLRYDHRHYEAHFNLGNIYAEIGEVPLAKIHYEIAIEIEPGFSNSYFNLGLLLVMNHKYDEAIKWLKKYLEIAPQGEYQPALELINKISELL